jgi:hypothetical protein
MADTYAFTFSLEELVLLMRIADLPALASLPANPFESVSEERALGALAAAERSLRARGFLQPQGPEKPFAVYSPVLALIGTCKLARAIAMVIAQPEDQPTDARYYYVSPYMAVEHAFPDEGLHRFTGAPSIDDLADPIKQFLHLDGQQALDALPAGSLAPTAMEAARNAASAEVAFQTLIDQDVPEALAQPLSQSFVHPVCVGTVSVSVPDTPNPRRNAGLIVDQRTVWLLEQEHSDGPFRVVSISAQDAIRRVCDLMRPPAGDAQGSDGRNQ